MNTLPNKKWVDDNDLQSDIESAASNPHVYDSMVESVAFNGQYVSPNQYESQLNI